jgi:hypothetical protein
LHFTGPLALRVPFGVPGGPCSRVDLGDGDYSVANAVARGVGELHVDRVQARFAAVIEDLSRCGRVPKGQWSHRVQTLLRSIIEKAKMTRTINRIIPNPMNITGSFL